ncbi:MAG: type II secretion system GspH family protein [Clostridiales bacterium]|nr:type II secretion system GspH family protein [Clostridiales bacterium]
MKNSKRNKGFTLVELIVVIAVLMVLTVLAVLAVNNITEAARRAAISTDANTIARQLRAINGLAVGNGYNHIGVSGVRDVAAGVATVTVWRDTANNLTALPPDPEDDGVLAVQFVSIAAATDVLVPIIVGGNGDLAAMTGNAIDSVTQSEFELSVEVPRERIHEVIRVIRYTNGSWGVDMDRLESLDDETVVISGNSTYPPH